MGPAMSPTAARLRALAFALGSGSLDDVNRVWGELKATAHTRELYHSYPDAVSSIVQFSRMRAGGNLTGGEAGFSEMIEKVISAATRAT